MTQPRGPPGVSTGVGLWWRWEERPWHRLPRLKRHCCLEQRTERQRHLRKVTQREVTAALTQARLGRPRVALVSWLVTRGLRCSPGWSRCPQPRPAQPCPAAGSGVGMWAARTSPPVARRWRCRPPVLGPVPAWPRPQRIQGLPRAASPGQLPRQVVSGWGHAFPRTPVPPGHLIAELCSPEAGHESVPSSPWETGVASVGDPKTGHRRPPGPACPPWRRRSRPGKERPC